ncbi:Serine/threonine-protein kinase rio2, partial [Cryomyces antarcticus]
MLSVDHANAEFYFDRDVSCIKRFFERRFHFSSDEPGPFFSDVKKTMGRDSKRLDVEVEATGFSKRMAKELEVYMRDVGVDGDAETEDALEGDRDDNEPPSADEVEIEDIGDEKLQQADVA